jgi:SAM-dependent methyltransferase
MSAADQQTADAFATSWNNLPGGSVYTYEQFVDWLAPLSASDVEGKTVLELGCGNASLLVHMTRWNPSQLLGVDLGDSVRSARENLARTGFSPGQIVQGDLTAFESEGFDVVYCIGVLHHLKEPRAGFHSVLRNTKPGGRFHCWVYAHEGNALVRLIVEPTRRIASRLPWWLTKYGLATPLVAPYFLYAKLLARLPRNPLTDALPLADYSHWIARRDFAFFRHVAFDQLVTPQTAYLSRGEIEAWLREHADEIEPGSSYVIFRNGNSWKFGGRKRSAASAPLSS